MLCNDLYLIKVDSVKRIVVLDKNNKIQIRVIKGFRQENKAIITKIIWLSNKKALKTYDSIIMYLIKASDTHKLLIKGFFYTKEESEYISAFKY